jgi:membrane-associated phospholipid phosphatase
VLVAYLLAVGGFMLLTGAALTGDRFLVALALAMVLSGRGGSFLRDWAPFAVMLLAYEAMRGIADDVGGGAHFQSLIDWERSLFGGVVPTIWLQERFYDPDHVRWYDLVALGAYLGHFITPVGVALVFWLMDRAHYWRFITMLVLVSLLGFVIFLLYPAAPPWLAYREGYLDRVYPVIPDLLGALHVSQDPSWAYRQLSPNPVAALPSLHAAWPWLIFLSLWVWRRKAAWLFLPYPVVVWASIVYLGEHYVVDVLAGVLWATGTFVVCWRFLFPRIGLLDRSAAADGEPAER